MLGNPKYKIGDVVRFRFGDRTQSGVVAIVDRWGTFENANDASYDILSKEENMLYKHVTEPLVIEKTGEIPQEEVWKL